MTSSYVTRAGPGFDTRRLHHKHITRNEMEIILAIMGMLNTEPAKDFNTGLTAPQLGVTIEFPDIDWIITPNYPTASSSS